MTTDETRRCIAIFLAGQLATATDLAAAFRRLHPDQAEIAAAYLAAVERMRRVCDGQTTADDWSDMALFAEVA